jgi:hypothetical protein
MSTLLFFLFFSVDATQSDGMGRLVNDIDWQTKANCVMKVVMVKNVPYLCLFATKDLEPGMELRYDYGDPEQPWRKKVGFFQIFVCVNLLNHHVFLVDVLP